jgi:hypothetical protein
VSFENENFILTVDNFLNKEECEYIINSYKKDLTETHPLSKNNYFYKEINLSEFKYIDRIAELTNSYIKKYPESDMTSSCWSLSNLRFKFFKKGDSFSTFHSEVCMSSLYRFLSIIIYLTEHECGTEFFYNKKTIPSKLGRVTIFPAYFTHTHKGQPDFKNDRCIINGYYSFYKEGINEQKLNKIV